MGALHMEHGLPKQNWLKLLEYTFLYFLLYSILGWVYEVFLEVVVYRWGFSNRGVLFGPYCVIYGFGALLLVVLLSKLKQKKLRLGPIPVTPLVVFLAVVAIATVVELIGSYIMEWTTGQWLWDYRAYAWNFQGRIALNPSIRFGMGGIVVLYLIHPAFQRLVRHIPARLLHILCALLALLFLADVVYTYWP